MTDRQPNQISGYLFLSPLFVRTLAILGSSLFMGHIPTHPFPEASPDPNPTLTQTLDLTQGRGGTWPASEQGPNTVCVHSIHCVAVVSYTVLASWSTHFRSGTLGRKSSNPSSMMVHAWYTSTAVLAKDMWTMAISQHQFYLDKRHVEVLMAAAALTQITAYITHKNLAVRKIMQMMRIVYAKKRDSVSTRLKQNMTQTIT